jgi:hypothetical protein
MRRPEATGFVRRNRPTNALGLRFNSACPKIHFSGNGVSQDLEIDMPWDIPGDPDKMAVIPAINAKTMPKSLTLNNLNKLRKAVRMSPSALLLVATVLLWPHTLPAQHTPPTSEEVEAFAERAASEKYVGKEVPVPDRIFNKLVAGVPAVDPFCNPDDRNILVAHQILLSSHRLGGLAIKGGGGCFCSPTGNCQLWIYQLKNGKYRMVLRRGSVQTFGFLKSRTHGYPDLVTWSHGSAMMSGAQLFRFDGNRYVASGGWDVQFEFSDDGQVNPDKTRITSHFTSNDQLPKTAKP